MATTQSKPTLIKLRQDTLATWLSVNPILAKAEVVCVFDTNNNPLGLKQGNGVLTFSALPWVGVSAIDPTVPYYTKGETSELIAQSNQTVRTELQLQIDNAALKVEAAALTAIAAKQVADGVAGSVNSAVEKATQAQTISEAAKTEVTKTTTDLNAFKLQTITSADKLGLSITELSGLISTLQSEKLNKGTMDNSLQLIKNGVPVKIHTPSTIRYVEKGYTGEGVGLEFAPFNSGIEALNSFTPLESGAIYYGAGQFQDSLILNTHCNKNLVGLAIATHYRTSIASLDIKGSSTQLGIENFEIVGNLSIAGPGDIIFNNNLLDGQVIYNSSGFTLFRKCTFQNNVLISSGTVEFEDCDFANTSTITIGNGAQVVSAGCECIKIIAQEGSEYLHLSGILSQLDVKAKARKVTLLTGSAASDTGNLIPISIAEGVAYSLGAFIYQITGSTIPTSTSRTQNDGLSASQIVAGIVSGTTSGYSTTSPYLSGHLIAIQEKLQSLQDTGLGGKDNSIKMLLTVDSIAAPTTITALASATTVGSLYASTISSTGIILQCVAGILSSTTASFTLSATNVQAIALTKTPVTAGSTFIVNESVAYMSQFITGLTQSDILAFTEPQIKAAIDTYDYLVPGINNSLKDTVGHHTDLINNLSFNYNTYQKKLVAGSSSNLLTAPTVEGGQPGTKAISDFQPIITGAASSVTDTNLAINRVLISDREGKITASLVTHNELSALQGVSNNIQSQIFSIKEVIPNTVSNANKLVDQSSMNAALRSFGGRSLSATIDGKPFETLALLQAATFFCYGTSRIEKASLNNNDSAIFLASAGDVTLEPVGTQCYALYLDQVWTFRYSLGVEFTPSQQAALDSGIVGPTSQEKGKYLKATGARSSAWEQIEVSDLPLVINSDTTGTAAIATKLGEATKGSATQPIYLQAGVPTVGTSLGTAAYEATTSFATSAQGLKADSALQPFDSHPANQFYATPVSIAGKPGFRALTSEDIPLLNQNTTGSSGSCTGAASRAAADSLGNILIDTYATKVELSEKETKIEYPIQDAQHKIYAGDKTFKSFQQLGLLGKSEILTDVTFFEVTRPGIVRWQLQYGKGSSGVGGEIKIAGIPTKGTASGEVPELGSAIDSTPAITLPYFTSGKLSGSTLLDSDKGKFLKHNGRESIPSWTDIQQLSGTLVQEEYTANNNMILVYGQDLKSSVTYTLLEKATLKLPHMPGIWNFKVNKSSINRNSIYTGISLTSEPKFKPTVTEAKYLKLTRGLYFSPYELAANNKDWLSTSDLCFTACNIGLNLTRVKTSVVFNSSVVEAYTEGQADPLKMEVNSSTATIVFIAPTLRKFTLAGKDSIIHLYGYSIGNSQPVLQIVDIDEYANNLTIYVHDNIQLKLPVYTITNGVMTSPSGHIQVIAIDNEVSNFITCDATATSGSGDGPYFSSNIIATVLSGSMPNYLPSMLSSNIFITGRADSARNAFLADEATVAKNALVIDDGDIN